MITRTKLKLREVGDDGKMASHGKFRAVTLFDSCIYQIGNDTNTFAEARMLCIEMATSSSDIFQVYDDKGNRHF